MQLSIIIINHKDIHESDTLYKYLTLNKKIAYKIYNIHKSYSSLLNVFIKYNL